MENSDAVSPGPSPERASDILSGEAVVRLSPYLALQHDLNDIYGRYTEYSDIISTHGQLAPLFGDSIFYSEVQRTAARIFGVPRPRLIAGNIYAPIEWVDVLREFLTPADFERQPTGMYRCRIRGNLIEVTYENYIEILTGVTDRLLQPLQHLTEEQREARVRLRLTSYLYQTHQILVQFDTAVRETIEALDRYQPIYGGTPNPTAHAGNPSSTGNAEVQLPTPTSARRSGPNRLVIYVSDTESESDESARNIKQEAESPLHEHSGVVGNNLVQSMPSGTNGMIKAEPSENLPSNPVHAPMFTHYSGPSTNFLQGSYNDSSSDAGFYGGASSDIYPNTSTDWASDSNGHPSSVHNSQNVSSSSANNANDYSSSSDGHWGGYSDLASNTNVDSGLVTNDILQAATTTNLASNNNSDAQVAVNNTSARNNQVAETTDSNANFNANDTFGGNANANVEPSGLTSETTSVPLRLRLPNIDAPGNIDEDAQSSGSDIPWRIKSEGASHSPDTVAEQHETTSRGSKRRRAEAVPGPSGSQPRSSQRYSQLEEDEGPEFVKSLVNKGSTGAEIEEEYSERFGTFRTAGALFKKFDIKGVWGLLQSHQLAKRQKAMVRKSLLHS
ncbi:unnamed protein product [Penicillium glandicola]